MPAKSAAQRRLMAAAEHGATFPMAKKVRASMSHAQMREFATTKESKLPQHVQHAKTSHVSGPGNRYDRLRHGR